MRSTALLAAGASLLTWACSGPQFDATVEGETTVQGSPLGGALDALPALGSFTSLDFDQNQDFQNQGVSKDEVSSVRLRALRLRILRPGDQDFSFLDELSFYAEAGDQEVLIAERTGIAELQLDAPNPTLELRVKGEELQPFVTAPSMSIIVRGKGRVPTGNVTLQAVATFAVQADGI